MDADADLGAIMADLAGIGLGVALTWRAVSVPVLRDDAQLYRQDLVGEQVLLGDLVVFVQTSAIPSGARIGDLVTAGATSYQVRDLRKIGDGLVTAVPLVAA